MDWQMLTVFPVLSLGAGMYMGLLSRSLLQAAFYTLFGFGLVLTTALMGITKYDGILVWLAGPVITLGPFLLVLKLKYPKQLQKLNDSLKGSSPPS